VVTAGGASSVPVTVQIANTAPAIAAVTLPGLPVSIGTTPLSPGDTVNLTVTGLDPAVAANYVGRLRVTVGGIDMAIQQINALGAGSFQVQVVITQSFSSSQVPMALVVDGATSAPVTVVVR